MLKRKYELSGRVIFALVASAASISYYVTDTVRQRDLEREIPKAVARGYMDGMSDGVTLGRNLEAFERTFVKPYLPDKNLLEDKVEEEIVEREEGK